MLGIGSLMLQPYVCILNCDLVFSIVALELLVVAQHELPSTFNVLQ